MKKLSFLAVSMFACGALFAADSEAKADVTAAAKKLADKGNYSWTSTPKFGGGGGGGNFRPGPTEGQAEAGTVHLKMSFGDRNPEAVIKGEKVAIKGEDAWESADELEGNRAFMARRLKTMKAPAEEAQDLAEKSKALKKEGDTISGELTEEAVKALLTFGPRNPNSNRPDPKNAKGSVKFWHKDGALSKYEYNVKGTIVGREDQEMDVDRTTTVEIKNVGTTKLNVPEEAKKKLG
jgi:hypothetical protein